MRPFMTYAARAAALTGAFATTSLVALAQTYTDTAATGTTSPGIPDTGAGGDLMMNAVLLGFSAILVASGAAYFLWERYA